LTVDSKILSFGGPPLRKEYRKPMVKLRASDLLRLALQRLETTGWCQGPFMAGRSCALVAICETRRAHADAYRPPEPRRLEEFRSPEDHLWAAVVELDGSVDPRARRIPEWNDAPGRTWVEVQAVFRRAVVLAREWEATHPW